jgi:hypothetical protein
MATTRAVPSVLLLIACGGVTPVTGQTSSAEQIARAVLAAPASMRDEATVLGYGGQAREGDPLTVLREGANGIVCLADDPAGEGFHVACYHESMDPFMALGRRLRASGEDRDAVQQARRAAIEAGDLEPPSAALWSLTAPADVDPAVGPGDDARRLTVVYVPYADSGELGLPVQPDGDSPWLMLPGTPWAHIMISR